MRSIPCSVTSSSSKSRRRTVERKSREGSRSRNVCQEPADGIINAKLPRFPVQRAQLYFFPASSSSTRPVKNVENIRGKVVAPISTGVHFFFLFVFSDWAEEAVAKAEILRLIYQGRFLHSNVTLGALGLPFGKTTVMHLVPRENLPEPNSQGKSSNSRYRVYPFGGGWRGGGTTSDVLHLRGRRRTFVLSAKIEHGLIHKRWILSSEYIIVAVDRFSLQ